MCQDLCVSKHFKTVLFVFSLISLLFGYTAYAEDFPRFSPQISIDKQKQSPDELLVRFTKDVIAQSQASEIAKSHGAVKVKSFRRPRQLSESAIDQWRLVKLNPGQNLEQAMQRFANDPAVEVVEPNYELSIIAYPNDPFFDNLWGMDNDGQSGGSVDADIDAPEAWDIYTGSNSVLVAVIDTGVDYNHEDLADNIWTNTGEIPGNGIDDDGNGYIDDIHGYDFVNNDGDPMDDNGHGTHVSGTIAAVGNNGIGVAGVNWDATIMGLKFLGYDGFGSASDAISAILYATDMGARLTSNSWGGNGGSQALLDAINAADAANVLFVAAAGNDGRNTDSYPKYPQGFDAPNILSVAATDHDDNKASFSNYGATSVDLGAPGVDVLSTFPTAIFPSGYAWGSGTSMATPHVSGAAALLLSLDPSLTPAELINILMSTVDPIPALAGISVSGGRLNVNTAVNFAANLKFIVTATPGSQTIMYGETSTTYTTTVKSFNGFSKFVDLSVSSPEPTISGDFSPNKVKPTANGTIDSILTVSTTSQTPRGTYQLTILATDVHGETSTTYVTVVVEAPDFALSISPASRTIAPDGETTYTVQLNSLYSYNESVSLSFSATDSNISGSFSLNPVTVPADGTVTSTLTVTTTASAPLGDFTLTVEGTDGVITYTRTVNLTVLDVDLVMTDVSTTATSVPIGTNFPFDFTVQNQGTSATSSNTRIDLYLSTDANITTSDTNIGNWTQYSTLWGGESISKTLWKSVPIGLAPGTYYIGAIVDASNWQDETDETNNALAGTTIEVIQDVDLVLTNVSTTATSVPTGTNFPFDFTVQNQGTSATSSNTRIDLYLSTDANITTSDTNIGNWTQYSTFWWGESISKTLWKSVPSSLAPGTYYIGAIVDAPNWQDETDETNNALAGSTIEVIRDIDLIMTNVSTTATSVPTGTSFPFDFTVANQGTSSTSSTVHVNMYLSTDANITTSDTSLGSWQTSGGLSGGWSISKTFWKSVPSSLAPGTYYIGAIVDFPNWQDETDETNNALAGSTIEVIRDIDLVMTNVSTTATSVPTGTSFPFDFTVANQGTSSTSSTVHVNMYLSTDANITTSDTSLGSWQTSGGLSGGWSISKTFWKSVPSSLAPGTYYIGAIVDFPNWQDETDETNNALAGSTIEVIRDIDLIMTDVSTTATTLSTGSSITISSTVKNQGTSSTTTYSYVRVYLSTDANITTSDISMGSWIVGLSAGDSWTEDITTTIPSSLTPGTYYIGAIADASNQESESDETNNSLAGSTIEVTSP